jgi:integrase/recombinase XerC
MNSDHLGPLADPTLPVLRVQEVMLNQMLIGWAHEQQARTLQERTITERARVVREFAKFSEAYPWEWTSHDFTTFIAHKRHGKFGIAHSTARSHADAIRSICRYLSNPGYPWAEECDRRFGSFPVQIVNEWNSRPHKGEFESMAERRMFSRNELQTLFDVADDRVSNRRGNGRKGQHVALRDSQMIKTTFAFGLRLSEVAGLEVVDCRSNPYWPAMGGYASLHVRFGKSSNGGPPKRRTVLGIPQFEAASLGLKQWVEEGRPSFGHADEGPMWPSERGMRISKRGFEARFQSLRDEAGLPDELTLHCLRHTYITRIQEEGYSERFAMAQAGHAYPSTTAGYTSIGDEYGRAAVRKALGRMNDLGFDAESSSDSNNSAEEDSA